MNWSLSGLQLNSYFVESTRMIIPVLWLPILLPQVLPHSLSCSVITRLTYHCTVEPVLTIVIVLPTGGMTAVSIVVIIVSTLCNADLNILKCVLAVAVLTTFKGPISHTMITKITKMPHHRLIHQLRAWGLSGGRVQLMNALRQLVATMSDC